jgi:CheY-like chemotaxis protein
MLTDVNMPGVDGFTLVEQVKQNRRLAGVTVLMLTSAGQRGDATRCREMGVAAYLTKPVGQSELFHAMARVLGSETQVPSGTLLTRHSLRETSNGPRVLLAEDNMVNQRLAVRLLEKRGYTVVVAADGHEALAAFDEQTFDLVLMDVQMPLMGGFEVTAAIREREKATGAHTPIVAMTARAMKGDREECLAAGMDDYLAKPIRTQELFEILDRLAQPPVLPALQDCFQS